MNIQGDEQNNDLNVNSKRKLGANHVFWFVVGSSCLIVVLYVVVNLCWIIPKIAEMSPKVAKDNGVSDAFISEILTAALAIIGLAISVWTGLNIVNTIERKDFDELKDKLAENSVKATQLADSTRKDLENVRKTMNKVSATHRKQEELDHQSFIHELYKSRADEATAILIPKLEKIEKCQDVKILWEIENNFALVYKNFRAARVDKEQLQNNVKRGIELATGLLSKYKDDEVLQTYLKLRIADFHFYVGYHCNISDSLEHFEVAINTYFEIAAFFNASIPKYVDGQMNISSIEEKIKKSMQNMFAYYCNSIGEAYSKMSENSWKKDKSEIGRLQAETYGKKASFYCSCAVMVDSREVYVRNQACAIERSCLGDITKEYTKLCELYDKSLQLNANVKSFKTRLSITDKFFNEKLDIKPVKPSEDREKPLNNSFYKERWLGLEEEDAKKIKDDLENNLRLAKYAKIIFPSDEVGYTYACLYYRDMCIITEDKNIKESMIQKANDELDVLKFIQPNAPLTRILEKDIEVLGKDESE